MSEQEINQKVAEEICNKYRLNGREFKRGECVALLDGKIVAVEKDLTAAFEVLRALDTDPKRGMLFEVGPLVADVIRRDQYVAQGWI
jgi:hypothetical protein